MRALSINDLLRERRFEAAVARMQEACRVYDPEVPVDADQVRREFEAKRTELRAVVPPEPFKVTVTYVNRAGGAR